MRTKRQNNQLELAFGKECKGEALSGLVEGTEVCVARAGTERPAVFISLNPSNRHVRTRMRGGVGGVESRDSPLSRLPFYNWKEVFLRAKSGFFVVVPNKPKRKKKR